jgi:hypothetical protein
VSTLLAALKLMPSVILSVQAIETAIPLPATGKAKLDLLLGMITDVSNADQAIQKDLSAAQLASVVTVTATRVVASFNALGIFHKSK